ncbi:MAG: PhzF family phenazine biosynthesis protein [Acidimicrobiales bacterium]
MTRAFKQVDVFTSTLGSGNPVAVVLDGEGLSDDEMAQFAAWTNLSETTFVLSPTDPGADYYVRIFTPNQELPFAGHPTIGSCHAWLEAGGQPASGDVIVQQCGAGLVTLRKIDGRLTFETPPCARSGVVDTALIDSVLADLGLSRDHVVDTSWADNGPGWIGVLVTNVDVLRALTPTWDSIEIKAGVAALTGATEPGVPALEVRAFFHAGGTREDPVTGSLNGSLGQWLLGNGTLVAPYIASQGVSMGRNGRVYVSQADDGGVWIGGDAVTGVNGTVAL